MRVISFSKVSLILMIRKYRRRPSRVLACLQMPWALSFLLLTCATVSRTTHAIESHPGISSESMYSEAVLAFNKKQSSEALRILDELLRTSPNHVEALELKALTLKSQGDDRNSLDVYNRLIRLKPDKERGPYHFELGVILNRQKKSDIARVQFEKALALGFNETVSHLFLGMIGFSNGDLNASRVHFRAVESQGNAEMQTVAHYYLGMIHFKEGNGSSGTHEMNLARTTAKDSPDSKMASDIKLAAEKVLAPFRNSQWFASITAIGQYDSNIALIPSGLASAQASNKGTPNTLLNAGFGRMSPPVDDVQWVASYRFSGNKTLSAETKAYDFASNTPSLFLNLSPLSPVTGGIKLEGNLTFNNQPTSSTATANDGTATYRFTKYSTAYEAGTYLRFEPATRFLVQLDLGMRKQTNYADPGLTGTSLLAKANIRGASSSKLLNPALTVSYESNRASNPDSKYNSTGIGASNGFRLSSSDTVTASLDYLASTYPAHALLRADKNISGRVSLIHVFTPKWSFLADVSYTTNTSSIANSFSYSRMSGGAGIGWSL